MKVNNFYLRKLFKHDLTHEVSITQGLLSGFFEYSFSEPRELSFKTKDGEEGIVTLNNAGDPRFGRDFKKLISSIGTAEESDIVVIQKIDKSNYLIDLSKEGDDNYDTFNQLIDEEERHATISLDYNEDINYLALDNKEFIFKCLELMDENELLTEENIDILTNKDECAQRFFHYNAILNANKEAQTDSNGYQRYYTDCYVINGKEYLVSKEWKRRDLFVEWIKTLMNHISFDAEIDNDKSLNKIYFGAPGTGKSFQIDVDKEELVGDSDRYERVTFHPDYTYANFVGTYKPISKTIYDESKNERTIISYEYQPGPFMRILVKALKGIIEGKSEKYLLIVEEINRANIAAVFGDIFQLLDRGENGVSEYPINTSEDMKKYLSKELKVEESELSELKIPNNMFIWATMNSADQGVFPMDTAFKRRWDFEYLGINNHHEKLDGCTIEIGGQILNWDNLRKSINQRLSSLKINEDKLIGPFFIGIKDFKKDKESENSVHINQVFKDKVLMYLFEDAAKQKRKDIFNIEKLETDNAILYSEICSIYDKYGIEVFHEEIQNRYKELEMLSEKDR